MARVTVEDCIEKVENRFQLIHLSAKRVRQLRKGAKSMSDRDNKDIVLSLREIAAGQVTLRNIDELEPKPREHFEIVETYDDDDDDDILEVELLEEDEE